MESHILNTYHQARYRTIGHKLMRMKSDSLSSEGSCHQNSPEYAQISVAQRAHSEESNEGWCQNQTMNTTQSSQDTSSDDDSSTEDNGFLAAPNGVSNTVDDSDEDLDDNIIVHEVNVDDDENVEVDDDDVDVDVSHSNASHNFPIVTNGIEDNTLVEGHDYDVITVYTVNPDLDLIEASSEDERDVDYIVEKNIDDAEYINGEYISYNYRDPNTSHDGIDINLDTPVVSNVDEYFIKNNNNDNTANILDTDGPVVKDVDEYFIKDKGKDTVDVPNVDDFLVKHKLPNEDSTPYQHLPEPDPEPEPEPEPKAEEFLVVENDVNENKDSEAVEQEEQNNADVSINESDLEILPNIEDLKRYLLEDMSYMKFRNIQKSCSVPQSPMQNLCMDIDDAKTCLSFEDLNLDLSDLAFDNEKDKTSSTDKSDDLPRTLTDEDVNSFLITNKTETKPVIQNIDDDLSHQDMEIEERPLVTTIAAGPDPATTEADVKPILDPIPIQLPSRKRTSTPIPILDFCVEKTTIKKDVSEIKPEPDDFVDVESCNDMVIPVLEATNLNSLLEQFEATEKYNTKKKSVVKTEDSNIKNLNKNTLTSGMRLQDAGVQLNKNKMRQILMPSTINTAVRRSQSPVHSDHDYCSSKKRLSLPNLKGGQSLLKPEVLSSNNRILNSRHRSCKSKKIVYNLSSDDESDSNSKNKKVTKPDDIDIKKKISVKPSVKPPVQSNCRKKLSPPHSAPDSFTDKANNSVMNKSASKASDNCSQNSNGSIKLTIKNKSEVILSCDLIDSQKDKHIDKCKDSVSDKTNHEPSKQEKEKHTKELDRNKVKTVNNVEIVKVKEEPRPKNEKSENFYTALFSNKQDVQVPQPLQVKTEKRPFEDELNKCMEAAIKKESEQPHKRKKLNLQEYKMRRGVSSANGSAQVSPEAIFPDMPNPSFTTIKCLVIPPPANGLVSTTDKVVNEQQLFDPIKEASRKILMNTKKQKAEAMRKRDEDIVMSKIPKVENLELQPLISDAEMMKIVGMTQPEVIPKAANEKPQVPADYEEIILVSIGINTDDTMFKKFEQREKPKARSPQNDSKINFKIKKSDHVLKQNVFDSVKRDIKRPDEKKHSEVKIDKERFKDITATLKSVEKQVDTKISSNSLFASIQDVVKKKAPDEEAGRSHDRHQSKSPTEKRTFKLVKTTIVRDYDPNAEHGEDKVILHLGKSRTKPSSTHIVVQTDSIPEFTDLVSLPQEKEVTSRKRTDSDMSMSSDCSPARKKQAESPPHKKEIKTTKTDDRAVKPKAEARPDKDRRTDKDKRSRSKDRYDSKYRRRSRSMSRSRRRRSRSRSRSRSRGRFRRYRRPESPYKRKRRSRSPYKRRSPSPRRERPVRSRSRSRSRPAEARAKSPVVKKKATPPANGVEKKTKSMTPPPRKPTVSESSESSTSSSSSSSSASSSSSSSGSEKSRRSCSPYNREEPYKKVYRCYSSEDRESNTPVEERRIVFVGRLEKDITKATLRGQFCKFGPVMEVRLHSKEDGSRYGFVTYQRARDAWSAVEAASTFPQYDVGFGGRRAFCRQSYADLDGLEAKYTESAFHGQGAPPVRHDDGLSFEQMLLEMKKKLSQRKNEKKRTEDTKP